MIRKLFQNQKTDDEHSMKLLYDMFYSHVYKTAFFITKDPQLAEDVLQETFIKVFRNLNKLEDGAKMKTWITTIASRTAIDFIRKKKRGNEFEIENVNDIKVNFNELAFTVEEEVERSFLSEMIREEIANLPPDYRTVLCMKYIEDLKDQEIANHLQLKVTTVKTRIHRAKKLLKKELESKNN